MNKTERLCYIIFALINYKRMTTAYFAEKLGVSDRTIIRDIETLKKIGIPIRTITGNSGGLELDNFSVNSTFFTENEMFSIYSALNAVSSFLMPHSFNSSIEKINTLFDHKDKNIVPKILFDIGKWGPFGIRKEHLNLMLKAIETQKLVSFNYTNRNMESYTISVEPHTLVSKSSDWYLIAFNRGKQSFRFYKISRMSNIKIIEYPFSPRVEDFPYHMIENHNWYTEDRVELIAKIDKKKIIFLNDYFDEYEVIDSDGIIDTVKIIAHHESFIHRKLLPLGEFIEILEPIEIRDKIKEIIANMHEKYS